MSVQNDGKKYQPFKIPNHQQIQNNTLSGLPTKQKKETLSEDLFYEIEYDSCPIAGVGRFVLKNHKKQLPENDEINKMFYNMRDIARQYYSPHINHLRFFDKRVQKENAKVFYKQAVFMKDFKDDYEKQVHFSSYYPNYQMMSYEQLRTYFTWRTQVRNGIIENTSISYVFLYIYELLNNIGVINPQDGVEKLMFFWNSFKKFDSSIDRYVLRWLKDYHIYYNLPQTFKEFTEKYNFTQYYAKISDAENDFDFFCAISKYDIRKSGFFTDKTSDMLKDCFAFVLKKIRQNFETAGIDFDDALFSPIKNTMPWKPFKDALFHQQLNQSDKRVIISENEIYICNKNEWITSTVITTEKGKQFIGYVMKKMESVLRKIVKYKFKISANIDMIDQETTFNLRKAGLFIEKIVQDAVMEFYKEITKTVVSVNHNSLARIRQQALLTQESLNVSEELISNESNNLSCSAMTKPNENIFDEFSNKSSICADDPWKALKDDMSIIELQTLAVLLQGGDIKKIANENKIMIEVLVDGINEKAVEHIGDNILNDNMLLYEEYVEQTKGLMEFYDKSGAEKDSECFD